MYDEKYESDNLLDLTRNLESQSFRLCLGIEKWHRSVISNEFKKWEASKFLPKLKTTTYSSLHKLIGDIDLLVLDESQCVTTNNCVKLLSKKLNPTIIIGTTGTPSKDKEKQSIYQSLGLVERYNISIKEAQKSNIISDYRVNVLYKELSKEKDLLTKGGKFKTSEIKMYEWYSSKIEEALMTNNYKSQKFYSDRKSVV